jgi:putative transposase
MATIPRRPFVVTPAEELAFNLPPQVTFALTHISGAVKTGLLSLCVGAGLAVVKEIMEAEVTELVGPRGRHDPNRVAYRHGEEDRQLTLGGRRVEIQKPRARTKDQKEVELGSYEFFAGRDLLNQAALDRMLHGLSSRHYRFGLEPVGMPPLGTGKSAISHRFVAGTRSISMAYLRL